MKKIMLCAALAAFMLFTASCTAVEMSQPPVEPSPEASPGDVQSPSPSPEEELPESSDALLYVTYTDAQVLGFILDEGILEEGLSAYEAELMLGAFYACYDALGIEYTAVSAPADAPTLSAFVELVYQALSSTELPAGAAAAGGADVFLRQTGIYYGERAYEPNSAANGGEAALMLARAVTYAARATQTGAKGLLWEVSDSDTTVYLLGSVHVDNAMIYPFGENLTEIILGCDALVLEVDFGDEDGIVYLQENCYYGEDDKLSNHISAELMDELLALYTPYGVTEAGILEPFRPWVLASEILNLALYAEENLAMQVPMDLFIYQKAIEAGVAVRQIEGYEFQTDLFNALDDAVMEEYLKACVDAYNGEEDGDYAESVEAVLKAWRAGDPEAFYSVYDKDSQEDALSLALFEQRDVNMFEYVKALLEQETGVYLVTVGAGHMVGETGIVKRLADAGYSASLAA